MNQIIDKTSPDPDETVVYVRTSVDNESRDDEINKIGYYD